MSYVCHLLYLAGLTVSVITGQTLASITGSIAPGENLTDQIRTFSDIGQGGDGTTPRPWVCQTGGVSDVVWQGPGGSSIPTGTGQATGSQLFTIFISNTGLALLRGPDYNSPDGEYCCVVTTTNERRCVTLTTCPTLSPPTYTNGRITYDPGTNVATYGCVDGYTPSVTGAAVQRTCQSNNLWTDVSLPTITCTEIVCPTLMNPSNGTVTLNGNQRLDDTATYSCNPGYNLTGSATRVCGASGEWTLPAPTCEPVDCGGLPLPTNGTITLTGTTFGSNATYSCNNGYTLTGSAARVCGASGEWKSTAPTCEPVDCGGLPPPINGTITLTGTTFGSNATYGCNNGYYLAGSNSVMCAANGSWSPQPLVEVCIGASLDVTGVHAAINVQLHFSGVSNCPEYIQQTEAASNKNAIMDELIRGVNNLCGCGFNSSFLLDTSFQCFTNSPLYVTYRAILTETPAVTAVELTGFINEWLANTMSIPNVSLSLESACLLDTADTNSVECPPDPTTTPVAENFWMLAGGFTGGGMVAFTVVALAFVVIQVVIGKHWTSGSDPPQAEADIVLKESPPKAPQSVRSSSSHDYEEVRDAQNLYVSIEEPAVCETHLANDVSEQEEGYYTSMIEREEAYYAPILGPAEGYYESL